MARKDSDCCVLSSRILPNNFFDFYSVKFANDTYNLKYFNPTQTREAFEAHKVDSHFL